MMDANLTSTNYPMRKPCQNCGHEYGTRIFTNGQAVIKCAHCGKYQYNAPKHEQGLAPEPVRSDAIKPKLRYEIQERAKRRCEFCGADASERVMHVGHLLSEKDIRANGLPLEWADSPDNLAWICDACNLGMGARSFTLHDALVWAIKRQLQVQP